MRADAAGQKRTAGPARLRLRRGLAGASALFDHILSVLFSVGLSLFCFSYL
ncbi:hypothetical protein Hsero_1596 [Herbaspirillum seropedicae SmR1]|uniref:Uncharacterized protein n=1 Tax=Herbaspirillum seropedicae (strain SmR1) TaxID=757424 RepID=D8IQ63_HERSS|nr:hypothetical protein Hsero_1596 [Herbaspirillum seropedicae SmR1]